MDWSGVAPLYESPNCVIFTSCWLHSASPITYSHLCMLIECGGIIDRSMFREPLPSASLAFKPYQRKCVSKRDYSVVVYSILCTVTKAERKTREVRIYLRCRFTH